MRKTFYRLIANSIALFHLLWGLWGAVGIVLALNGYYPKHPFAWTVYLVAMVGNGLYLKYLKHCPLTIWEKNIRIQYSPKAKILDTYSTYYLEKLTGMKTTAGIVWVFIWSIYLGNFLALLIWK